MEKYPKEFYCPISQELMKDPVIGPDGQSYEKSAIIDWLSRNSVSPLTRQPMNRHQLIPNFALKNAIENMTKEQEQRNVAVPVALPLPAPKMIKNTETNLNLQAIQPKEGTGLLHISIAPSMEGNRNPSVFICLVDTSGSMGASAALRGKDEATSFSVLDLIKHSLKTIIHMLTPDDYLAIISFSDSAKVVVSLKKMTDQEKKKAGNLVEQMVPDQGTNMWDALRVALNLIKENPVCSTLNTVMYLFTDGVPNINPPRGVVSTLYTFVSIMEQHFTIHTFGFGYDLDSHLLKDIAIIGNGIYCYLPDCNLVGTTFINALCNSLITASSGTMLEIQSTGITDLHCVGYPLISNTINVGSLQYGQTRDFILQFKAPKDSPFEISVHLKLKNRDIKKSVSEYKLHDSPKFYQELARCSYVAVLIYLLELIIIIIM